MKARWRAVVALGLALVLLAPSTASAHDTLIDSAPGHNEQLGSSPQAIRLTYSAHVLQMGAAVVVADQDEVTWPTTEVEFNGPDVTVDLESELPEGRYQVRWRVVSSDGHPISGIVPFVVGDPPPATDDDASHASTPAAEEPAQADMAAAATSGPPGWLRMILVGAGGAGIALLLLFAFTRWRTPRHPRTTPSGGGAGGGDEP